MRTLNPPRPKATDVRCTDDALEVTLSNGLVISTPLSQFPRLRKGSPEQRRNWEFIGGGVGIHWEALDEDISVKGLLQSIAQHIPKSSFQGMGQNQNKRTTKVKVSLPA
jgi:hypothetical protein